jgi:hypothetical protein
MARKKAVAVYLEPKIHSRLQDWCLGANLTRKGTRVGHSVAALGAGVNRILELFLGNAEEDRMDELEERVARLEKTLMENNNAKR